jgi:Flp pilus assembly protein TadD
MQEALRKYQQAFAICREMGNHSGEGAILNNIGAVYDDLGQKDKALDFHGQAFAIFQEVGDRWSESTLLSNIGVLLDAMGRTAEAVTYLEQCVALMEDVGHPSLDNARAVLERVRGKLGNG